MDYSVRCCRLTLPDRVRNADIQNIMGISMSTLESIGMKRLRWYGHVQMMSSETRPRRIGHIS